MHNAVCDSCNAPLAGVTPILVTGTKVGLTFDLCPRCQARLVMTLRELLVCHQPRLLAA